MKNDNRQVVKWITLRNGVHVPLYEGQTEADITKNLEEYMKGKQGKKRYRDILQENDIWEATAQFAADTKIAVMEDVINEVDDESLTQVYDTLGEIKERYGEDGVNVITLYNEETVDDCDPNTFAAMDDGGKLYLNSIYFSNRPNDITDLYKESVDDKFHPKCPDGIAGIVTHEIGHGVLFKKMHDYNNANGGTADDYLTAYKWCLNEQIGNTNSKLFRTMLDKINKVQDKIYNNKQVQKAWGGKPNMSVQGIAGQPIPGIGVSGYARTNIFELLAESYADVFWNEESASLISKEIYKEFYKKRW